MLLLFTKLLPNIKGSLRKFHKSFRRPHRNTGTRHVIKLQLPSTAHSERPLSHDWLARPMPFQAPRRLFYDGAHLQMRPPTPEGEGVRLNAANAILRGLLLWQAKGDDLKREDAMWGKGSFLLGETSSKWQAKQRTLWQDWIWTSLQKKYFQCLLWDLAPRTGFNVYLPGMKIHWWQRYTTVKILHCIW